MGELDNIASFIKYYREKMNLSQEQLAEMSGTGVHLIRDIEQGKSIKTVEKINSIVALFGYRLSPVPMTNNAFQIRIKYLDKAVKIIKTDKQLIYGFLVKEITDETGNIVAWKFVQNPYAIEWEKTKDDKLTIKLKQSDIEEISLQKQ